MSKHKLLQMALFSCFWFALAFRCSAQQQLFVHPIDSGAVISNPGVGWVFPYYDDSVIQYGNDLWPSDTLDDFPNLTVAYMRLAWSYIEPSEGTFNWAMIDTPAQRWIAKGKRIALRFTCAETDVNAPYYATPAWVKAAGAQGYNFIRGQGVVPAGPWWEPKYDDPIFLQKLEHFLAAAAARYDGNPNVAFIDVGSFGAWGEGDTSNTTNLPYSADVIRTHIDLYRRYFKKTTIVVNDDFANQGRGTQAIDYARQNALGFRDDSILAGGPTNAYSSAVLANGFWQNAPVVLEAQYYGVIKSYWESGTKFLQAIEDYHASYASFQWFPREFLQDNRDFINRANQRLGYRLQLVEASWPSTAKAGGQLTLSTQWKNAGVAPMTVGGYAAITLYDHDGQIAATFVLSDMNLRSLQVGPPGIAPTAGTQHTYTLPFFVKPGTYGVYVSVGDLDSTPRIRLPLANENGQRRYSLGVLTVN